MSVSTFASIAKGGLGPICDAAWPCASAGSSRIARTLEVYYSHDHAQTAAYISASFAPAPSAPLEPGFRAFVEKLRKN